ncbi:hypothetical protein FAM18119_02886 [Lacticaseibacillus paracasei]|nr:hypothetical protein FAM18119_02886 [Lacticaseibacillus paracasei]
MNERIFWQRHKKTANQRAEEAKKHSYAAVKERLTQEQTETDTELKA